MHGIVSYSAVDMEVQQIGLSRQFGRRVEKEKTSSNRVTLKTTARMVNYGEADDNSGDVQFR